MKKIIALTLCLCCLLGCKAVNDFFHRDKFEEFNNPQVLSTDKFEMIKYSLRQSADKFQAENATFLLMDTQDNTLVSSYTLNGQPTAATPYEAGEIMGIFTVAMGLESGMVRPDEQIDTLQPIKVGFMTIKDFGDYNEMMTPSDVLLHSSKIGSARIALKTGGVYQHDFLKTIGFLDKIDMKDIVVAPSYYPNKNSWLLSDMRIAAIGYGYGFFPTPLHLISAYSAMINGGIYYKPSFKFAPEKKGLRVISEDTSLFLRQALRNVVVNGDAQSAALEETEVSGKTATAHRLSKQNKYTNDVRTSFIGHFDYLGKEYALLLILDNPLGLKDTFGFKTSGWNAVPAAAEIIRIITQ